THNSALAMAAMFVPLMDTIRIFSIRLIQGRSPFDPDVNHIHHLLLARGMSHTKVTLMLSSLAIVAIFLAYFLQQFGMHAIIVGLVMLGAIFVAISKTIHVPLNLDTSLFGPGKKSERISIKKSISSNGK
ncbi:MAG: hypothetical protein ACKO03_00025, partial [Bacteroidota bacterium]